MTILEKIFAFFNSLFAFDIESENRGLPDKENKSNGSEEVALPENTQELEVAIEAAENAKMESRIKIVKMTLTRLYILKQKTVIFKESFPEKYHYFEDQIDKLEKDYNESLLAIQSDLTYEIDPETDGEKLGKLRMLEYEAESFIEKEVKFNIIFKKFQKIILKLNILYNVSVRHTAPEEKKKAMSQLVHAIELETQLVQDFKNCEYLLLDARLKDEIIKLVSYLDYEIFKLTVRNSAIAPSEILNRLIVIVEFKGFDYASTFRAYLEDELTGINDLISNVKTAECKKIFTKKYENILEDLAYSGNLEQLLLDTKFWSKVFELENNVFGVLADEEVVDKEKIKIKIFSGMKITVTEDDVLISPKTTTYLELANIFSKKQDDRITLVTKLLKNISDDITYKEIYYILVLFDAIDLVKNTPNELIGHIEKYLLKYPYGKKEIEKRKEQVFNSNNDEYVYAFSLKEAEMNLLDTLKELKIDYVVQEEKNVLINSFYFSGLTTVINSLVNLKI